MPDVGAGVGGSGGGNTASSTPFITPTPPLGKYQGFIYLGLSIVAISLSSSAFGPAIAAVLALAITMEAIYAYGGNIQNILGVPGVSQPSGTLAV